MKKKIALAACFLALALASAACGSETKDPGTDSRPSGEGSSAPASDSGTESNDPEATRYSLPEPELPELNYGGAAFVMYPGSSEDGYYHESVLFPAASYLWVEKLNGEVVNDAVFNRNLAVENKFNVKITVLDTETKPEMLVMAGEPMDLVQAQGPYLAETVDTGAWLNMIGFPYLNLEAEYWSPRCLAGTIVDDIAFFMPSDICMDPLSATGILYFNKRLIAENDMESPYDLVHENRWTIDTFMEMVKQGPRDLNGDGKMDLSDQYGALIRHQWRTGVFMQLYFGIGLTYTKVDPDQGRVLNFNGEIAQGLLDQVCEIFKDKKISMPAYEVEELGEEASYYETMFAEGRALFCQDFVSSLDIFREMDDDFGIVPNPKYNRSQEEY